MTRYSFMASVSDCGYCSNDFRERNSIIVYSADRKTHTTCLGKGSLAGYVMDHNSPTEVMKLRDLDPTCKCADCKADVPVEFNEDAGEVACMKGAEDLS